MLFAQQLRRDDGLPGGSAIARARRWLVAGADDAVPLAADQRQDEHGQRDHALFQKMTGSLRPMTAVKANNQIPSASVT